MINYLIRNFHIIIVVVLNSELSLYLIINKKLQLKKKLKELFIQFLKI